MSGNHEVHFLFVIWPTFPSQIEGITDLFLSKYLEIFSYVQFFQVNVVNYKARPNAKEYIQVEILVEKNTQKIILIGRVCHLYQNSVDHLWNCGIYFVQDIELWQYCQYYYCFSGLCLLSLSLILQYLLHTRIYIFALMLILKMPSNLK